MFPVTHILPFWKLSNRPSVQYYNCQFPLVLLLFLPLSPPPFFFKAFTTYWSLLVMQTGRQSLVFIKRFESYKSLYMVVCSECHAFSSGPDKYLFHVHSATVHFLQYNSSFQKKRGLQVSSENVAATKSPESMSCFFYDTKWEFLCSASFHGW